jgi:hypothetical protein
MAKPRREGGIYTLDLRGKYKVLGINALLVGLYPL